MALVELAHAVWRVGSGRPRVAVLGGIHGNERTGIEVVRSLVRRFSEPTAAAKVQGELTLAIGNPEAVSQDLRFVDVDLNRCFGDSTLLPLGREIARAAELAPHLRGLDVLVDLHATNKPSEPFARLPGAMEPGYFRRCERLFLSALPTHCRTVLWDPQGLIAAGAMTDEFALRTAPAGAEGAYICYESGIASDVTAVNDTANAVDAMLSETGLLRSHDSLEGPRPREWAHYEIFHCFRLDDHGFEWLNGHGSANFSLIPKGEAYGRRAADGPKLVAQEDCYMVFPKVASLWGAGRPLGWLARRVPRLGVAAL